MCFHKVSWHGCLESITGLCKKFLHFLNFPFLLLPIDQGSQGTSLTELSRDFLYYPVSTTIPAEVPAIVLLLPEGLDLPLQLVNLLVFGLGGLAHRLVEVDLKVECGSLSVWPSSKL